MSLDLEQESEDIYEKYFEIYKDVLTEEEYNSIHDNFLFQFTDDYINKRIDCLNNELRSEECAMYGGKDVEKKFKEEINILTNGSYHDLMVYYQDDLETDILVYLTNKKKCFNYTSKEYFAHNKNENLIPNDIDTLLNHENNSYKYS